MFAIRFPVFLSLCLFPLLTNAADFVLASPTIVPGSFLTEKQVYQGFGCNGENLSPALEWTTGPEGTQSYAVTVYDPDAPTGSGWWHWVVYNIPADIRGLAENAGNASGDLLPAGAVQGRTDFGSRDFGGACPPKGVKLHHYIFTIHALKIEKLEIPANSTAAMIGFMINANSLDTASFTALYGR